MRQVALDDVGGRWQKGVGFRVDLALYPVGPDPAGIALDGQGIVESGEEDGQALIQQFARERDGCRPAGVD